MAQPPRFPYRQPAHVRLPSKDIRPQALARLYERRMAVDNLIAALERYQQGQRA